jgi:hypothetical protein
MRSASNRSAGNPTDIGAVNAQILQFAAGHAAKFCNGLTELEPVVERACYVHDNPLSEGCMTSAALLGPGVVSMSGI